MVRRVVCYELTDVSEVLTASIIRALVEAASISETSIKICRTMRCNIIEDSRIHIRRRENLKSLILKEIDVSVCCELLLQMLHSNSRLSMHQSMKSES
jgi:hypothetical protein